MHIIDSHCHLDFEEFDQDFDEVINRARENNIKGMQTICTKISNFKKILEIANKQENIWCSIGNHPHNTEDEKISFEDIHHFCNSDKVIGIGETGLDYYYENSNRESQKKSFVDHIRISKETKLPLIIHARKADNEIMELLLSENNDKDIRGVIHCFTSSMEMAKQALKMGLYISFSGIITFKNAEEIRECCKMVPSDRILVETDSPFLAPVPNRGKRNEPSFIIETLKQISEIKNVDVKEMAEITTNNFFKLFSKASINNDKK